MTSASDTFFPPVCALLKSACTFSSVASTFASSSGELAFQSFCGARRTRAPFAPPRLSVPQPMQWKEKKGPKCIAVADIGGALVSAPDAVDLLMAGGKRLRAHLDDDCGPMDFYNGFYLRPKADGKVCADRDVLRMRSGASCGIARFKTLVAR